MPGNSPRNVFGYMYRLLFLFYIEARPELGYAPMSQEAYRTGYSLESLRELEMTPLTTEESQNGTYIHDSLNLLFNTLIYEGFVPKQKGLQFGDRPQHDIFEMKALKSHLFDPLRTPLLNRVKFRNSVLQPGDPAHVLIQGQGEERPARADFIPPVGDQPVGGRCMRRCCPYKGFFAETDLYEVKKGRGDAQ